MKVWIVFLLCFGSGLAQTIARCPNPGDIRPCSCSVKKNGLDVICESTDHGHINKALTALKQQNSVIFYLKLRHNNLPKLPGFVFLGLVVQHLAIHNSSLATVEENSLSSIGKFDFWDKNLILNFFWVGKIFTQKISWLKKIFEVVKIFFEILFLIEVIFF